MDFPIILKSSSRKWLLLLLGSMIFVAAGIWMITDDATNAIIGWVSILFFGACGLVSLALLIRPSRLVIDASGFEEDTLFGKNRKLWDRVENFHTLSASRGGSMVAFDVIGGELSRLETLNASAGYSPGFLRDTYGMSADALAALLDEAKQAAEAQ